MEAVLGAHDYAYPEEWATVVYRIEKMREKTILCTEYTVTHLWYRKRTSGVQTNQDAAAIFQIGIWYGKICCSVIGLETNNAYICDNDRVNSSLIL